MKGYKCPASQMADTSSSVMINATSSTRTEDLDTGPAAGRRRLAEPGAGVFDPAPQRPAEWNANNQRPDGFVVDVSHQRLRSRGMRPE